MADVLDNLPVDTNPNLLVGFNTADDAGIYKINDRQALVQTVDFFPPIVDDPYIFGQIAAANALSDVYAMGGRPLTALNIVGFPAVMPPYILTDILKGGGEKIREAGAAVVGGHSIKDKELKYGFAVTGIIDIDKIITNSNAQIGDKLYLTKPLGTGIITTAIKKNAADTESAEYVMKLMTQLNKTAAELMLKYGVHSATDVTGFGILGHAYEIANASGVSIKISFNRLPIIPRALEYAEAGNLTGGANANMEYLKDKVQISADLKKAELDILYDAQTSGGLLIVLPPESGEKFLAESKSLNLSVSEIGEVVEKSQFGIVVE
ncbi:MAG TPA: selenide, water dikinase SelD [candidate division Zixibacteria bacterium]|nr:selenide, water dikinase SelD [candidate division Zixibacteria bacterium]